MRKYSICNKCEMFVEESSDQFLRSKVHQQLEKISCSWKICSKIQKWENFSRFFFHFSLELSINKFLSWPVKNGRFWTSVALCRIGSVGWIFIWGLACIFVNNLNFWNILSIHKHGVSAWLTLPHWSPHSYKDYGIVEPEVTFWNLRVLYVFCYIFVWCVYVVKNIWACLCIIFYVWVFLCHVWCVYAQCTYAKTHVYCVYN